MQVRAAISGAFAVGSMVGLTSVGCGGAREEYVPVSRPRSVQSVETRRGIDVPDATMRKMKACVERGASRLTERSYALQYDVAVNERGNVLQVKLRDATLQDTELEGCFRQALGAMSIPVDALDLRRAGPISGGERITREHRGPLGVTKALAPIAVMAPIIIQAAGVTIFVGVGIAIAAGVTKAADAYDDYKRRKRECSQHRTACLESELADEEGHLHGHSRCEWCFEACMRNDGIWPPYAHAPQGTVSCRY